MPLFVYVDSLKGPVPQVWHDKPVNGSGQSKKPLQSIEIPDGCEKLPLSTLSECFPYKGAPRDA